MPGIARTKATLRVFGDDLNPDDVTRMLGASPTASTRKGDARTRPSGEPWLERTGSWRLKASELEPGNLDAQIQQIFAALTPDMAVWADLSDRFRLDMFCGLFMRKGNEGLEISPESLAALGARGVTLGLDIYERETD